MQALKLNGLCPDASPLALTKASTSGNLKLRKREDELPLESLGAGCQTGLWMSIRPQALLGGGSFATSMLPL